jgi:hypothetical protein
MQVFSRVALAAALLAGCSMFAKADEVLWTLNDVVFNGGYVVTGWFETDSTDLTNYINVFDLSVTGGTNSSLDFTIMSSDPDPLEFDYAALPDEIGFGKEPGFSPFVDLNVVGGLSATGGTFSLASGFLCPGCPTLDTNGYTPTVSGVLGGTPPSPTPEPATLPLLGAAMLGLAAIAGRRLARAN